MPRNASGVYALPDSPVVTGTVIDAPDENTTRNDIAAEMTNSLDRNGRGGMLAAFRIFDGTLGAPGLAFTADTDNGIFRNSANDWSIVAGATEVARITANTFTIPATATLNVLGTLTVFGALAIGSLAVNDISPPFLGANTDNWNPTGLSGAAMIRASSDASRNLTGLAGGTEGRLIWIHNVGAFNIVLIDESANSTAANRFALQGDFTLMPDAAILLQYDITSTRWRQVGNYAAPFAQTLLSAANAGAALTALGASAFFQTLFPAANAGAALTTLGFSAFFQTLVSAANAGVLNAALPLAQNSQSVNYTTVLADAEKHLLHPTADNNPRTFTIDSNANVAFPVGTMITFVNQINVLTIAITTDTLTMAGSASTGSRILAANGVATALKVTATSWYISGTGLS